MQPFTTPAATAHIRFAATADTQLWGANSTLESDQRITHRSHITMRNRTTDWPDTPSTLTGITWGAT